mmetsp:Transcript_131902/g.410041  ORF Transcript_131902/g.410041 Transcript_131902/m.410041 type:complete len:466 (+) Transcript_131902:102-1499(+)
MQTQVLVVGGGPVGLSLALGLLQKGFAVTVLEKDRTPSDDWSTTYTYRVDSRGIACLRSLGLLRKLEAIGVESRGFSRVVWKADGSRAARSSSAALGLGYWIQRPALLGILEAALPKGTIVHGELEDLNFGDTAAARVRVQGSSMTIYSRLVFGCDGSRSAVRKSLQAAEGGELASAFEQRAIRTPSTGLIFRAVLYEPPEDLEPGKLCSPEGKSGRLLSLLPFAGRPGQLRPLSFAQAADHPFHNLRTPEDVYAMLREDFPQLDADRRLPPASAAAWCSSPGSTFPHARWCGRAAYSAGSDRACAALLGDALHCFPPDLGQGVNAGLEDVRTLLSLMPSSFFDGAAVWRSLERYEALRVPEAEAICRLLPVGMPYQYKLPHSLGKFAFFGSLLVRLAASRACPSLFPAPVVFLVTSDPPLLYTEILRRHREATRRLLLLAGGLGALVAALGTLRVRRAPLASAR